MSDIYIINIYTRISSLTSPRKEIFPNKLDYQEWKSALKPCIETFWKKSKEMRISCGVKCWKKPAPKRNKEQLINMLRHSTALYFDSTC